MTKDDYEVVCAMEAHGGEFIRSLAQAAKLADPQNLFTIKKSWPHYWTKYQAFANVRAGKVTT